MRFFQLFLVFLIFLGLGSCSSDSATVVAETDQAIDYQKVINPIPAEYSNSSTLAQNVVSDAQKMEELEREQKKLEEEKRLKEEAEQKKREAEEAAQEKAAKAKAEAAAKKKAVKKKKAKMKFEEEIHEFGIIKPGEVIEHKYYFTNTGEADLVITKADVTCGCTTPSYPFVPIPPGEKGFIGVTYDSTGKLGQQKPTITLTTNAGRKKIYMKGIVISEMAKN